MVNPWELHCLPRCRFVRCSHLDSVTGHLVELHLVTSRTTHEDYYSEYAIPSNETKPPASQNMPGKYTMQFHHPNRPLGTAHKSRFCHTPRTPSQADLVWVEQQLSGMNLIY